MELFYFFVFLAAFMISGGLRLIIMLKARKKKALEGSVNQESAQQHENSTQLDGMNQSQINTSYMYQPQQAVTPVEKQSYGPVIKDTDLKHSYDPKPTKMKQPKQDNIFTISAPKTNLKKKNDYNEPPPLTLKRF